ncbi:MAG TPA: hypothetical protein VNS22_07770 [Geminicoccus sp.]|uniref:hypothetical protein n=1 Tax=Geminicoccus sp. TaxID=2024832 RepID=UPI002C9408B4|nr:hypothetical protein [Geminicoccus sp.]HWL68270.1 hypothetical protein [Geminicoccus sp.]
MRTSCFALPFLLSIQPAASHDWYEALRSADGLPCCGEHDCHPVPYRLNTRTGMEEIEVDDHWWPVDPRQVVPSAAPDGRVHACWSTYRRNPAHPRAKTPSFRCIILPRTSSLDLATVG